MARERRQFSRAFKLEAVRRFREAPNVEALSAELGIRRELLYKWDAKLKAGGEAALRNAGRPRPEAGSAQALSAERRIAELERLLGRKNLEIDFLDGALRRIEASRPPSGGPGGTAASPRSRR